MLNHHPFVRIVHPAFIPVRHLFGLLNKRQALQNVFRRRPTVYQALQQRIRRHAVGTVQTGIADLTDGVQPVEIGAAVLIDHHAAAGVVRRRDDRDRLSGQIEAQRQQLLVDHREVLGDELRRLVADVQVHAVGAQALHFMVDGAGDDIARGQFAARVKIGHKAAAVRALSGKPLRRAALRSAGSCAPADGTGRSGGTG